MITPLDFAMDQLGCDAVIAKTSQFSKRRSRRNRDDANMEKMKQENRPDGYPPHFAALDQRDRCIICNGIVAVCTRATTVQCVLRTLASRPYYVRTYKQGLKNCNGYEAFLQVSVSMYSCHNKRPQILSVRAEASTYARMRVACL